MNFGVLEVANSKATAAPGWAYVPDTGVNASVAALQPGRSKRARNQNIATTSDTTAKQDAKLIRELEELTKENHREVVIPIPVKKAGVGRANQKATPAVRKILASMKTFNNHLDDFINLKIIAPPPPPTQPILIPPTILATPTTPGTPVSKPAPHLTSKGTRSHKKKDPSQLLRAPPGMSHLRKVASLSALPQKPVAAIATTAMPAQPTKTLVVLSMFPPPPKHPGDSDKLLVSRIPKMPTQEEINKLVSAPPLSYEEAKGTTGVGRPVRVFCEVCGYWGRVRCVRCGGRVCALECLDVHKEECFTRYGA